MVCLQAIVNMKENYKKIVLIWLATGAILVAMMVVIGGITRLTHSGLSMVEWKPVTGIFPPISLEDWEKEFDNYKQYPEYQKINFAFTLSDFKSIYWWEYIHRLLGRVLGIAFIVPFIFFMLKKVFERELKLKLLILLCLGALQGFLGWFMVKSGLSNMPAVSHYRLAIHLLAAFGLFSYILWLIFHINPVKRVEVSYRFKTTTWGLLFCVVLQIIYGAFVAGLKAGLIFNTYPKMGGQWISDIVFQSFNSMGILSLLEEQVTIQFIHRWLPLIVLVVIFYLWYIKVRSHFSNHKPLLFISGTFTLQVLLGIFTLIYNVPVFLGILHQVGGLILLSGVVWLLYSNHIPIPRDKPVTT